MVALMEDLGTKDPFLEELRGKKVTYYIDVKATEGRFEEQFTMTWSQHTMVSKPGPHLQSAMSNVRQARKFMFRVHENPKCNPPKEVYVLVRICHVNDVRPEIHFLLDPWSDVAKRRHIVRFSEAVVTPTNPRRFRDAMAE
jgi:hypothetical protein